MVVHINLDETCVKLCPCLPRGAVAVDGGSTKKEALEQEHEASLHARRSAMTFVCSVCDDTIVQRALPQVIIGNERVPPPERGEHLEQQRHRQYFGLAPKELVGESGQDGPVMRKNQREGRGGQQVEDETGALRLADAAAAPSSTDSAV